MNPINDVQISTIKIGDRYRKDMGDLQVLADSIEELGLLQPIGINPNYQLIWGERRLRAFELLGRDKIPARIVPMERLIKGEFTENEIRKDFNPVERVEISRAFRNENPNKQGERTDLHKPCQNFDKVESPPIVGRKNDIAADEGGFNNHETLRQAEYAVDHGSPELVDALSKGDASISAAAKVATLPPEEQDEIVARGPAEIKAAAKAIRQQETEQRREQRIEKLKEQAAGNRELDISSQYPVIYADPPWNYEFSGSDSRDLDNQYPTMDLEAILGLPVDQLATRDCVLFLWTTAPKLPEGMAVLNCWGFTYKTCAVWDKEKIGMGYWFRQQSELLLVGTRGSIPPPEPSNRPSSVIRSPREKHSQKPEQVYRVIEAMYPDLPRIELFARNRREGWSAFGNEHDNA